MEEKVICVFMPNFWIEKAATHADLGDYVTCFDCLEEAKSRTDEDDEYFNLYVGK